ncbi:MAG: hypothetical protein SGARI_000715, partial [Bacillariaceae sp.]
VELNVDDDFTIEDDEFSVEDFFPGANKSFGLCSAPEPYFTILLVLIIVSQVITCGMSCRLRRIPQDISDSRRVCQTICFHLVVALLGVIVSLIGIFFGNVRVQAIAIMLVTFLTVAASLGFLVAPKMYSVGYQRFKGHAPGEQIGGQVHVTGINAGRLPSTEPTRPPSTFVEGSVGLHPHQENCSVPETSPATRAISAEEKNVPHAAGTAKEENLPPEERAVPIEDELETGETS